jgi:hypothetical protein
VLLAGKGHIGVANDIKFNKLLIRPITNHMYVYRYRQNKQNSLHSSVIYFNVQFDELYLTYILSYLSTQIPIG